MGGSGCIVAQQNTGHCHSIVDGSKVQRGAAVPAADTVRPSCAGPMTHGSSAMFDSLVLQVHICCRCDEQPSYAQTAFFGSPVQRSPSVPGTEVASSETAACSRDA